MSSSERGTATTPLQRNDECRSLAAKFREVLAAAAKERDSRQFTVRGPDGYDEMGWVAYERHEMRAAVDAERKDRGLPPVHRDDLLRAERLATGHSDYAAKFAWSCAELVMYPADQEAAPAAAGQED